jgi:hypothetical protein
MQWREVDDLVRARADGPMPGARRHRTYRLGCERLAHEANAYGRLREAASHGSVIRWEASSPVNQTRAERRVVVASAVVRADLKTIFDILADVTRHAEIDGSGMLVGDAIGPRRLSLGAEFTIGMSQAGRGYRSFNRVVEFEDGHRIAWESMGVWRGHKIVGGQRWRWTLAATEAGTRVVHSYVWGYARLPILTVWLPGYPARMAPALHRSLVNLSAAVSAGPTR